MTLIDCPECRRQVSSQALACPACGYPITQPAPLPVASVKSWNPGVAALLSLIIPGAGQIYKGQVLNGLVWLVLVVVGYILYIIPGIVLHMFCIFGAASGRAKSNQRKIEFNKDALYLILIIIAMITIGIILKMLIGQ